MPYADYNFYLEAYRGTAIGGEEEFGRLCTRASSYLDYISGGYAPAHPEEPAVKMAVCAVADAWLANESGGEVVSESVGSWSRSFASDNRTPGDRLLEAARMYLEPIGALRTVAWA